MISEYVEEEDFASLLEESFAGSANLTKGQSVDAMVVKISGDWIFIDTGCKGEGILCREEFLNEDGTLSVSEGETVRAIYLGQSDGESRFTTRIGTKGGQGSAQIEDVWRSSIPVEGTIEKEVKGGFEVRLPGAVRAFCPLSQIDLFRSDLSGYVGRRCDFRVIQYSENGRNIVISRRVILEEEAQRQKDLLREKLTVGMVVTATVRSILPFGAFIHTEGIDGLLPISELAWGHVKDPSEILSVGQVVQVKAKRLDWDNNKFSFSLRDAGADPWLCAGERYREGSYHIGTVSRLAPFGAFVTLEPGIDGLIHISKVRMGKRISHPREVVREGEKLEVKIDSIDLETRKISLSLAAVSRAADEDAQSVSDYRQFAAKGEKTTFGSFGDLLIKSSKSK